MSDEQINDTDNIIADLKAIVKEWSLFERKQLKTWRRRFYTGLLISTVIFLLFPTVTWVWWLVLGLSALSLLSFATVHYIIQKKLNEAYSKMALLKELEKQQKSENKLHN